MPGQEFFEIVKEAAITTVIASPSFFAGRHFDLLVLFQLFVLAKEQKGLADDLGDPAFGLLGQQLGGLNPGVGAAVLELDLDQFVRGQHFFQRGGEIVGNTILADHDQRGKMVPQAAQVAGLSARKIQFFAHVFILTRCN